MGSGFEKCRQSASWGIRSGRGIGQHQRRYFPDVYICGDYVTAPALPMTSGQCVSSHFVCVNTWFGVCDLYFYASHCDVWRHYFVDFVCLTYSDRMLVNVSNRNAAQYLFCVDRRPHWGRFRGILDVILNMMMIIITLVKIRPTASTARKSRNSLDVPRSALMMHATKM